MTVENGKLIRVEVKSSDRTSPQVFLSENERLRAKDYLTKEEEWRLLLFFKEREGGQFKHCDITDKIRDAVQNPSGNQGILKPADWVIRLLQSDSK